MDFSCASVELAQPQPRSTFCCVAPRRARTSLFNQLSAHYSPLCPPPWLGRTSCFKTRASPGCHAEEPLYRELVLPTHSKGLLMGDARACSGPCARQQASRGKNTLSQISLGERGDIPDHIPSPDLCPCATTQAGSSFAWQELLLGEFVPRLLFTRWFSLWMLLLHYV